VTDCNLMLGYLGQQSLLAGDMLIDLAAAEAAIGKRLAAPLGVDVRTAAAAVIDVVNHAMAEALKIVSVQRGHDPRDFSLAAFGGAGPLHAAALADELGIATVVCPPIPGAFSALGLVGTDLRRDYVRTVYTTAATADPSVLEAAFRAMEAEGSAMLERAGIDAGRRRFDRSVDARYAGQSYELNVPVAGGAVGAVAIDEIAEAFHARHAQTYGHDNPAEPVQFVSLRLAAIGIIPPLTVRQQPAAAGTRSAKSPREVWFHGTGTVKAQVHDRARMAEGVVIHGPAVIESLESTVLIPPGWQARMDGDGFILMARTNQGAAQ
jgi:N-methylhydantoinase A